MFVTTMALNSVGYSAAEAASAKAPDTSTKALLAMVQLLVAQGVTEVPKKCIQPEQFQVQQVSSTRIPTDTLAIPVIAMAGWTVRTRITLWLTSPELLRSRACFRYFKHSIMWAFRLIHSF